MSPTRSPVSTITGRRQGPALRVVSIVSFVLAALSVVSPGRLAVLAGVAAVGLVTAAPLLRVVWLVVRWAQERDWRFVVTALGLLAVVGAGATIAALGLR